MGRVFNTLVWRVINQRSLDECSEKLVNRGVFIRQFSGRGWHACGFGIDALGPFSWAHRVGGINVHAFGDARGNVGPVRVVAVCNVANCLWLARARLGHDYDCARHVMQLLRHGRGAIALKSNGRQPRRGRDGFRCETMARVYANHLAAYNAVLDCGLAACVYLVLGRSRGGKLYLRPRVDDTADGDLFQSSIGLEPRDQCLGNDDRRFGHAGVGGDVFRARTGKASG